MDSVKRKIGNTNSQNNFKSLNIGKIEIGINKTNYDNYKRSYEKLQSILAGVMSVINIILEIGRQIVNIFESKRMNKDIIEQLIYKKQILNEDKYKKKINNNKLKINNEIKVINADKKDIKTDKLSKTNILDNIEKSCELQINKSYERNKITNQEMKNIIVENSKSVGKINYCNIIRSFFGFNDIKSKFINSCNTIVNEDMCVEKLLKRLYNLENVYNYLSDDMEEESFIKNKEFNDIYKYIYEINREEKNDSLKDENNKDLNIDKNI